jgi:hypothetical protein
VTSLSNLTCGERNEIAPIVVFAQLFFFLLFFFSDTYTATMTTNPTKKTNSNSQFEYSVGKGPQGRSTNSSNNYNTYNSKVYQSNCCF